MQLGALFARQEVRNKMVIDWKIMKAIGITASAVIGCVTAWNMLAIPFLNSDLSPIAGTIRLKGVEVIQQQTVKTLQKTGETVDGVVKRLDRTACADWNRRLRAADEALNKDRSDPVALLLRSTALDQIFALEMCMLEPAR